MATKVSGGRIFSGLFITAVAVFLPREAGFVKWLFGGFAILGWLIIYSDYLKLHRHRDGPAVRQVSMKQRRLRGWVIDTVAAVFIGMIAAPHMMMIVMHWDEIETLRYIPYSVIVGEFAQLYHGQYNHRDELTWLAGLLAFIFFTLGSLFIPWAWWFSRGINACAGPFRNWRGIGGVGGVANWAGLLEEASDELSSGPGSIWLGLSSYEPMICALNDNRHFVTIAGTRGGKGRSVIIPTLLSYKGSAIVLDPKGENAAITARRRRELGQSVHILDPFGIVPGMETARFNPLAELELISDRIREDIEAIADGIVVPESGSGFHFSESARIIIAGFIAYLVAREPPENRTLPAMLELMMDQQRREQALSDMASNPACGGLMMQAVNILGIAAQSGGEGFSAYMSTLTRNLSWIGSKPMAHVLSASDFTLAELKTKPTTIYLCLQEQDLVEHKRFLRVVINLAINAIGATLKSPPHGTLFLLDEFHVLGPMEKVKTAAALMAGYGLKLWIVLQSLSQLKEAAPDAWETIMDTAGAVQVFSLGLDQETALWASQAMGRYPVIRRETRTDEKGRSEQVRIAEGVADLAAPGEVRALTERERMAQIVIRPGRNTLYLARANYDQTLYLFRGQFDPRPGEGASRRGARYEPPSRPRWAGTGWRDWMPSSKRGGSGGRRQEQRADPDPYKESLKMFGLKDGFTLAELKARYRELQKRVHPDLGGSDYFSSLLNSAYDYLKPRARP